MIMMTKAEAERRRMELGIEVLELQERMTALNDYRNPGERNRLGREKIGKIKEIGRLKLFLRDQMTAGPGSPPRPAPEAEPQPSIPYDPTMGDMLLLDALNAMVTAGIEVPVMTRIREYFRAAPKEPPPQSLDEEPKAPAPPAMAVPLRTKKSIPVFEPPKLGPMLRPFMDDAHRSAPGPGAVIYKKRSGVRE